MAKGNQIDVLLGADHYELMYSMKEIVGNKEPVARLCPLGWTAVGKIEQRNKAGLYHTTFSHTFRIHAVQSTTKDIPNEYSDLNSTLKRFWELETIGIIPSKESVMTPDEQQAWEKVSKSLKFNGKHYEIAVLWKDKRPDLPNNFPWPDRGCCPRRKSC